jgi:hypothetical protein
MNKYVICLNTISFEYYPKINCDLRSEGIALFMNIRDSIQENAGAYDSLSNLQ